MDSREETAWKSCSSEMPPVLPGTVPTRAGAALPGDASSPVDRIMLTSPATPLEGTATRPPGADAAGSGTEEVKPPGAGAAGAMPGYDAAEETPGSGDPIGPLDTGATPMP